MGGGFIGAKRKLNCCAIACYIPVCQELSFFPSIYSFPRSPRISCTLSDIYSETHLLDLVTYVLGIYGLKFVQFVLHIRRIGIYPYPYQPGSLDNVRGRKMDASHIVA